MEKNKVYFFILLLLNLISCSKNNIENGILYSKEQSDESYEASKSKAIDSIYYYIAKETSKEIDRNDYNIVAFSLKDHNLIDFNNNEIVKIKEYNKDNNFYTEIKINDKTIKKRTLEILNNLKKEGGINNNIFRANASIEITENAKLNPYIKQILTHNALKRAYESLYKILTNNNINVNEAVKLTNNAYILEESYSSNEYNVVVETMIE